MLRARNKLISLQPTILTAKSLDLGSGCGSVSRTVVFDPGGP